MEITLPIPEEVSIASSFDQVEKCPPDKVFGLAAAYKKDKHPSKMNLVIGAYRTEQGEPYVLPIVRSVEQQLAEVAGVGLNSRKEQASARTPRISRMHSIEKMADFVVEACSDKGLNKEYLPIRGMEEFISRSKALILGEDSVSLSENRVAGIQSLSGTGALRTGADFIAQHVPNTRVYWSNPTWANHPNIFKAAGLECGEPYRYWHADSKGLDFEGMMEDIENAPNKSLIVLHACAHNPTGVDPTESQWVRLSDLFLKKRHIAFFDCAYQGYATGDLDRDAFSVRLFDTKGIEMLIAQSYSKNMGLYGERVGCLCVTTSNQQNVAAIESQLAIIARTAYSNPPVHGARLVSAILGNRINTRTWNKELGEMAQRIVRMREALFDALNRLNVPGTWDHIVSQIGMFSYTGLTEKQVNLLRKRWHIYMLASGRISMASLSTKTAGYLAEAMKDVILNPQADHKRRYSMQLPEGITKDMVFNKSMVMVALDASENSDYAFQFAIDYVRDGDTVVLAHVLQGVEPDEKKATETFFEKYRQRAAKENIRTVEVLRSGEPGNQLVQISKELNAKALIICARDQNILKSVFIGSVSTYCVSHCDCPVIVVKGREE